MKKLSKKSKIFLSSILGLTLLVSTVSITAVACASDKKEEKTELQKKEDKYIELSITAALKLDPNINEEQKQALRNIARQTLDLAKSTANNDLAKYELALDALIAAFEAKNS